MTEVRERLIAAQRNGEILRVRYHGGSQPGSVRELIPVAIGSDQARCRCYTSGAVKSFAIGKMELLERGSAAEEGIEWKPHAAKRRDERPDVAIEDIYDRLAAELRAAGWHVALETYEFGSRIALYAITKKGTVRKSSSLDLIYEHTTADLVGTSTDKTAYENHRPRVRPWSIRAKGGKSLGTWQRCWPALALFWEPAGIPPRTDP